MTLRVLAAMLVLVGSLSGQNTIFIHDSNGNQAVGTLAKGNVFFHDSNGNIAVGTIRDGNVFLNTNSGQTIFGTAKNGNVFLSDNGGITTGTIRNGNIFLQSSDGSVTTGTYDSSGHMFSTTTSTPSTATVNAQQQETQNQAAYNAGYAMGAAMGRGIAVAVERHKLKAFCKKNPTAVYRGSGDFSGTLCPDAPFTFVQQASIDSFCVNNPGGEVRIGLHIVRCFTPPAYPNLKWARWEMEAFRNDYRTQKKLNSPGIEQALLDWTAWKETYCRLTVTKDTYRDLDGNKKHCK